MTATDFPGPSANPRLGLLRREVEQTVLKPFRSHGWDASVIREVDHGSYIEISASKGDQSRKIAILYSSSEINNSEYRILEKRVDHIFFQGQPYMLESFAQGVTIPVESLTSFFPFLVKLNKLLEPVRSPYTPPRQPHGSRSITSENPLESIIARLRQFTSLSYSPRRVRGLAGVA